MRQQVLVQCLRAEVHPLVAVPVAPHVSGARGAAAGQVGGGAAGLVWGGCWVYLPCPSCTPPAGSLRPACLAVGASLCGKWWGQGESREVEMGKGQPRSGGGHGASCSPATGQAPTN